MSGGEQMISAFVIPHSVATVYEWLYFAHLRGRLGW